MQQDKIKNRLVYNCYLHKSNGKMDKTLWSNSAIFNTIGTIIGLGPDFLLMVVLSVSRSLREATAWKKNVHHPYCALTPRKKLIISTMGNKKLTFLPRYTYRKAHGC